MRAPDLAGLVRAEGIIMAPGAYDALSARLIARRGFPAVYLTGYGTTASMLARPDIGFITGPEMWGMVRAICQVIDIPLIADAESGFGNAVNLVRTVREYEMAGAAAIHLEDQVVPKRHGGEATPEVVPMEEHAEKIRLAVKTRTRDSFLVIGRTDSLERLGLDEAIRRGKAYRKAGADIIFVHGISTARELQEVGRAVQGPKLVNASALTLSSQVDPPSVADLQAWGYRIVIFAIEPLFAAMGAADRMLERIAEKGPMAGLRELMMPKKDVEDSLGMDSYRQLETTYLPRG
jgi:2-methylisocitrate lyase-like PEP mutase family enzyme